MPALKKTLNLARLLLLRYLLRRLLRGFLGALLCGFLCCLGHRTSPDLNFFNVSSPSHYYIFRIFHRKFLIIFFDQQQFYASENTNSTFAKKFQA